MHKTCYIGNRRRAAGFSLVELLLAITFMAVIGVIASSSLLLFFQSSNYANVKTAAHLEGLMAMERIAQGMQQSTVVVIPNGQTPTRNLLAFSGSVNDDNDFYFGDALFPRIDEDPDTDWNGDNFPGIQLLDDDGDTSVDEGGNVSDDDEDGTADEEILNGIDDDGDGQIDEDLGADMNGDGSSGIEAMDDDGDGLIDEGALDDDDEDGTSNEDPMNFMVYQISGGQLLERGPSGTTDRVIANNVTTFSVTYEAPSPGVYGPRYLVTLILNDGNGDLITFNEYVFPRNTLQRTGKRVR